VRWCRGAGCEVEDCAKLPAGCVCKGGLQYGGVPHLSRLSFRAWAQGTPPTHM